MMGGGCTGYLAIPGSSGVTWQQMVRQQTLISVGGMWSMFCPGQDSNYLVSNSLFCWSCKIMINRNLTFLWLVSLHCHAWCQTGGLCSTLCHKALWAPSSNKYSHGNTQFNQNKIETFNYIKLFNSISDRTEVCTFENKSICFDSMDDRPTTFNVNVNTTVIVGFSRCFRQERSNWSASYHCSHFQWVWEESTTDCEVIDFLFCQSPTALISMKVLQFFILIFSKLTQSPSLVTFV